MEKNEICNSLALVLVAEGDEANVMLHARRHCLKWTSISVAYLCIFLLSYDIGTTHRDASIEPEVIEKAVSEPRYLVMQRLFQDRIEYLNASAILDMVHRELNQSLAVDSGRTRRANTTASERHGLVVYYDYTHHHIYFQQFLWLYSSWLQLSRSTNVRNDLVVFISSSSIPNDFVQLQNRTPTTQHANQFLVYPCVTLVDSILKQQYAYLSNFSVPFHLELARLFYWQQTRLSSLLLFLSAEYRRKLMPYDFLFRLDLDSFLMPTFSLYQPSSALVLGESIPYDQYTLNRLARILAGFPSKPKQVSRRTMTISWFGRLKLLTQLARRVILVALWLMKEEFTESERLHHLTYLNYPSWYVDGIFEYATSIVLTLSQYESTSPSTNHRFDCHRTLAHCLHLSLRDPSHHVRLSKHSLLALTEMNQSNLTTQESFIHRTVIKSNDMFNLYFS